MDRAVGGAGEDVLAGERGVGYAVDGTGMAGELRHEAVGEGHYMFEWWMGREDGFGRKGFSPRSGFAVKGGLRDKVIQGNSR